MILHFAWRCNHLKLCIPRTNETNRYFNGQQLWGARYILYYPFLILQNTIILIWKMKVHHFFMLYPIVTSQVIYISVNDVNIEYFNIHQAKKKNFHLTIWRVLLVIKAYGNIFASVKCKRQNANVHENMCICKVQKAMYVHKKQTIWMTSPTQHISCIRYYASIYIYQLKCFK